MAETRYTGPDIEALTRGKDAVFEETDLAVRREVDQTLRSQDELIEVWRSHGQIEGRPADTAVCLEQLAATVADAKPHPMARLGAYEHLAQLTERREPQNRQVIESMIELVLTEPNPRLQEAMLGVLGSRLDSRIVSEPEKYLPDMPVEGRERLRQQYANSLDALLNKIRVDSALPAEYRDFAEMAVGMRYRHEGKDLWSKMHYMTDLYRGDASRLWPAFGQIEIEPTETQSEHSGPLQFVHWLPQQKTRRLLPEGQIPSVEKLTQADSEPRAAGESGEVGQLIPLRVFAAYPRVDGTFDIVKLSKPDDREFIADLRRVKMDRSLKTKEERAEARRRILDAWRARVWDQLPKRDHAELTADQGMMLRVETLVDENLINTLLKKEFGRNNLAEIDPSGRLAKTIDAILESEDSTSDQMAQIEAAVRAFKAG